MKEYETGYACNDCYISALIGSFSSSDEIEWVCDDHIGENCRNCDKYGVGFGDWCTYGTCDLCDRTSLGYGVYHTFKLMSIEWHSKNRPPAYDATDCWHDSDEIEELVQRNTSQD